MQLVIGVVAIPPTVQDIALWRERCAKMRRVARAIGNGDVEVLSGAQQMTLYRDWLQVTTDPDFGIFARIAEDVRQLSTWEPGASPGGAAQPANTEALGTLARFYAQQARVAAESIAQRYCGS